MLRGVKWHHPERQEQLHVPWLKSTCTLHSAMLLLYVTKSNSVDKPGAQYKDRRRRWHPIPALLPGKSHGWGILIGCGPGWVRHDWATSLSCIGEGNGNPLQCSCLENPRDGGAWWAAVCGIAQNRTRLKQLSSSSRIAISRPFLYATLGLHGPVAVVPLQIFEPGVRERLYV